MLRFLYSHESNCKSTLHYRRIEQQCIRNCYFSLKYETAGDNEVVAVSIKLELFIYCRGGNNSDDWQLQSNKIINHKTLHQPACLRIHRLLTRIEIRSFQINLSKLKNKLKHPLSFLKFSAFISIYCKIFFNNVFGISIWK